MLVMKAKESTLNSKVGEVFVASRWNGQLLKIKGERNMPFYYSNSERWRRVT